jgi:hypothetical protein
MLRVLQVDELRRAMGFPNDYLFEHGSRRDRIKMIGNGVCTPGHGCSRRNAHVSLSIRDHLDLTTSRFLSSHGLPKSVLWEDWEVDYHPNSLILLARSDGFEPPTLRFEV